MALGLTCTIALAACNGNANTTPYTNAFGANANASSRFATASLPSKSVPGAQTIYFKTPGTLQDVAVAKPDVSSTATETSMTLFATPQDASKSWEEYNLEIDYSDGSSVIGYMYDGNSLFIRNPDRSSTLWDVEFTLVQSNVYLTMEKTAEIAAPATPAPTPTAAGNPNPCHGEICLHSISRANPESGTCEAVTAFATILGGVIGAAASADTLIGIGTVVGSLIGPEGTAAGFIFGSYAVAALGVSSYGSLVGSSVFGAIAATLCEAFTANPPGHYAGGGYLPPPYQTASGFWPTGTLGAAGDPTTSSSCCYPTPGPEDTPKPQLVP
jgi:hypothetical protein